MMTRRYIVCRAEGLVVDLEITNCFRCGSREHICSACSAKVDRVRASLGRTAQKRRLRTAHQETEHD